MSFSLFLKISRNGTPDTIANTLSYTSLYRISIVKKATVLPCKNLLIAKFNDIIDLPDPLLPPSRISSCVAKPPLTASNSDDSPDGYILKSSSRAKTSRQIWIRSSDGCEEINTNLRIRLVLNNGITALLGKSKANKSSCASLKIQQDNVDTFISKCFGKVIAKY